MAEESYYSGYRKSEGRACCGMAYSVDLRERIVEAVRERGYSIRAPAELFRVGHATGERYLKQHREKGNLTPGTSTGRPNLLTLEQKAVYSI